LWTLFWRVQDLCKIKLAKRAVQELLEKGCELELVYSDIEKMSVRVRTMNLVLLAEARTLHLQSLQQWKLLKQTGIFSMFNDLPTEHFFILLGPRWWEPQKTKPASMFKLAIDKFEKAIAATPDNSHLLRLFADALYIQATQNDVGNIFSSDFDIFIH
jgi:hypothetical protein